MRRHETFVGKIVEQGLRQEVHMKMDDVKIIGAAPYRAQHGEGVAQMVSIQVLGFVARRQQVLPPSWTSRWRIKQPGALAGQALPSTRRQRARFPDRASGGPLPREVQPALCASTFLYS
jgi:hypothetical protein